MTKKTVAINIIIAVLEIIFISGIVGYFNNSILTFYVMVLGLVGLLVIIYFRIVLLNPFRKEFKHIENNQFLKHIDLIKKAESIKGDKIEFKYVEINNLYNPAFYYHGTIYLNIKGIKQKDEFMEGMIAHELGHALSFRSSYFQICSMKYSTIFANIVLVLRNSHLTRRKKISKTVDNIFYFFFRLLNYADHFFLSPYFIEEEYIANKNACKLTDGHSLRTYYFNATHKKDTSMLRYDVRHPHPKDMIKHMEQFMNITEYDKDIYHIDNKIFFIANTKNTVEKNQKKLLYYLNVADQDIDFVSYEIGNMYYKALGTKKDIDIAYEYAFKAYNTGYKKSSLLLALIHEEKEELDKAIEYANEALENKVINASFIVNRITRKLQKINENETNEIE